MTNRGSAVEAEALVKRYEGKDGGVEAVRGVDLKVETGEVFGFLGPNGAGKSTAVKGVGIAAAIVVLGLIFGISIASGPLGFVLLVTLTALWAVVFTGFMQLVALKTRSAAATNSAGLIFFPLLFLTPNFVPRDLLTRPILPGYAVVIALGVLALALNVRVIRNYD